jgi:hypothetical protein
VNQHGTDPRAQYNLRVPSFTFCPAVATDVGAILAFWRQAAEDTGRSEAREGIQALLSRDPEALILAEDDEGIVGSLIAGWDRWRYHL